MTVPESPTAAAVTHALDQRAASYRADAGQFTERDDRDLYLDISRELAHCAYRLPILTVPDDQRDTLRTRLHLLHSDYTAQIIGIKYPATAAEYQRALLHQSGVPVFRHVQRILRAVEDEFYGSSADTAEPRA